MLVPCRKDTTICNYYMRLLHLYISGTYTNVRAAFVYATTSFAIIIDKMCMNFHVPVKFPTIVKYRTSF